MQKYDIDWLEQQENVKYLFFWGHTKKKGEVNQSCFSQWYESSFEVSGITYKTAEHWMMYHKALIFKNDDIANKIIQCATPAEAKKLGRKVKGFDDKVWNDERYDLVRRGNIHKFNQNQSLGEYLLNTNNRVLVEASPVDAIWGIGLAKDNEKAQNVKDWKGLNLLGFALMEARDFLNEKGFFEGDSLPE
ncbi:NADAR family protein [Fulvivirga sediminis]|uniref:NADAR family protein n=1 Tax=Fulvivirga sediminis TaxID=2803949 RepID=A0A937F881_9BACT|nr:NADAR family protein [Fulvivirga sediminis]MBL3655858.1 NADAR family protein [Fulvivirga sediminis]